jgi:hypothetical protein
MGISGGVDMMQFCAKHYTIKGGILPVTLLHLWRKRGLVADENRGQNYGLSL